MLDVPYSMAGDIQSPAAPSPKLHYRPRPPKLTSAAHPPVSYLVEQEHPDDITYRIGICTELIDYYRIEWADGPVEHVYDLKAHGIERC